MNDVCFVCDPRICLKLLLTPSPSLFASLTQLESLLDNNASMAVNIVLKCFPVSSKEVLAALHNMDTKVISDSVARGLFGIIPKPEDAMTLRNFKGDRATLETAERFLLELMDVSVCRV